MGPKSINPILGTCGDYPPMIINPYSFSAFSPRDLSPAAWWAFSDASTLYDATTGGSLVAANGSIARIEDKSGNGKHGTQATSGLRPIRKTGILNSKDVGSLNGYQSFDIDLTAPDQFTAFAVFNTAGLNRVNSSYATIVISMKGTYGIDLASTNVGGVGNSRAGWYDGNAQEGNTASFGTSSFGIVALTRDASNVILTATDGSTYSQARGSTAVFTSSYISQDVTGVQGHYGDMAEIIVFDRVLSGAEFAQMKSFLNGEYAIY